MEFNSNRSVLVVFEDQPSRDRAVQFCDGLVAQFWAECAFDINWCSFSALKDAKQSLCASSQAANADIIIYSMKPEGLLPREVRTWSDSWIEKRTHREGAIVGLLDPARERMDHANKYTWLRNVAHRAGLDYLMHAPRQMAVGIGSPEMAQDRAFRMSSVLNEILQDQHTSRRFLR